jgi:hypothetical protein
MPTQFPGSAVPAQLPGPSVTFPLTYNTMADYRSSFANQSQFTLDGEKPGPQNGPPRTDAAQRAAVAELFAAVFDFSKWTQTNNIQSPRAVDTICQASQYTPKQKIDRILGSSSSGDVHKIEQLMWAVLVSFY